MGKRKRLREQRQLRKAAEAELDDLRASLRSAYSVFNHTSDPQLLEASILEIGALQSRYDCAFREMKVNLSDSYSNPQNG